MHNKYEFSKDFHKAFSKLKAVIYAESNLENYPEQKDITIYTAEGFELMTISYKLNKEVIKWHKEVWEYSKEQYIPSEDGKLKFIRCVYPPHMNAKDLLDKLK